MVSTPFPVRRSLRGTRLFVILLFVMACFGALLLASGESLGAWILGFGLALEAMVIFQAFRPGWIYAVGTDGVTVRRTLGAVVLRREDVAAVEAVEGSRVEELVAGPQWAQVNAGRTMDFRAGMRARRELGRMVALCTAPVVFTQTRVGGPGAVRAVGARAHGRFVLVSLRDGTQRVLSPREVDGFVAAWRSAANRQGSA
jgi:uncharacterized membrane protein